MCARLCQLLLGETSGFWLRNWLAVNNSSTGAQQTSQMLPTHPTHCLGWNAPTLRPWKRRMCDTGWPNNWRSASYPGCWVGRQPWHPVHCSPGRGVNGWWIVWFDWRNWFSILARALLKLWCVGQQPRARSGWMSLIKWHKPCWAPHKLAIRSTLKSLAFEHQCLSHLPSNINANAPV